MYAEEAKVTAGLVITVNQEFQPKRTLQFVLRPGLQRHFPRPMIHWWCAYFGILVAYTRNEGSLIQKQRLHKRDNVRDYWTLSLPKGDEEAFAFMERHEKAVHRPRRSVKTIKQIRREKLELHQQWMRAVRNMPGERSSHANIMERADIHVTH